ncbi:MAG: hypothetical protein WCH35_11125 [Comamonadaceae bacterium]
MTQNITVAAPGRGWHATAKEAGNGLSEIILKSRGAASDHKLVGVT